MNLLYSKLYKNSSTIELIKWLAIITMFIDHTAFVFFDSDVYMRFIGRFAFIGFAFILAHNYRYFTCNKFDYKLRLVNWGTVSQIPFSLIFGGEINILFLLAAGLYTIDAIENIKKGKVLFPTLIISGSLILSLFSGYFIFGVLVIVLFYYAQNKYIFVTLIISIALLNYSTLYAISSIIALAIIYYIHTDIKIPRVNKYVFYTFYPLHLLTLFFLNVL